MTDWVWLREDVICAYHDAQIAEHSGLVGIKDRGAIESALMRPRHKANYGKPDAAELAAAYAFALAKAHGFNDGNKRAAWIAARLFLKLNGFDLRFDKIQAIDLMLKLTAGEIGEDHFADWLRERMAPV